jgi:hypothetical protein
MKPVTTQVEFDVALKAGETDFQIVGDIDLVVGGTTDCILRCNDSSQPRIVCNDSSQPRIVCNGSSQPRIVCNGSSQPRIVCNDSSQPRIVCNGSSQPRIVCHGSSQPRIDCYDSSQPRIDCYDSSQPRIVCHGSSQPRIVCHGSSQPRIVCHGSSQPRIDCYDSSQPRIDCYDSSQPRIVCNGSSQPRIVCHGSSQPRIDCYDSSQPRIVCHDSSQPRIDCHDSSQPRIVCNDSSQPRVSAAGHTQLVTSGHVAVDVTPASHVTILAEQVAHITGTPLLLTKIEPLTSVEAWCQEYGLQIVDGVVILFKAVRDDYKSSYGLMYAPGSIPVATDWDGGRAECGGGLHFSPRPVMALGFDREATRFVACPVAVADMRAPASGDSYKNKLKAKGCCGPVIECDIDGEPLLTAAVVTA